MRFAFPIWDCGQTKLPCCAMTSQNVVCDGCPKRSVGRAFFQVTMVNVAYGLTNLALGKDLAKVTPKSWWNNMKRGWEWDPDSFSVNQIGHPYQGNNYFTAARANGLSFWESAGLTAFGSGTWEYFGETHRASLNDFINTTLGGIAFGEMFHRAAWLVRDTQATGRQRRELAATALDPLTGYNRFRSGDASRVSAKPAEFVPTARGSTTSAGVVWRGNSGEDISTTTSPIVEVDLLYGNLGIRSCHRALRRVRGSAGFRRRQSRERGTDTGTAAQLAGARRSPPMDGGSELSVQQQRRIQVRCAVVRPCRGQGVQPRRALSPVGVRVGRGNDPRRRRFDRSGKPVSVTRVGGLGRSARHRRGVARVPDFGPGGNFGGILNIRHNNHDIFRMLYEAHHLHVLDGIRANHLLQRLRLDLNVPLKGNFGVGVTGEFFDSTRRTTRRPRSKIPTITIRSSGSP